MVRKRNGIRAAVLVLAALALAQGCARREVAHSSVPLDSNLVVNPSFERFAGPVPADWKLEPYSDVGTRDFQYGQSTEFKADGKASFFFRGLFNSDRPLVLVQRFPVTPGYRLSYSVKLKGDGLERLKWQRGQAGQNERQKEQYVGFYVRFYDRSGKRVNDRYWADSWTGHMIGTSDWREYGKTIDIQKSASTVEIGCINMMAGFIYFDDVKVKVLKPYPWMKTKTKHALFYYLEGHPFPPGTIEANEEFLAGCQKKLGVKVKGRVSYYYYPSQDMFRDMWEIKEYHERLIPTKREYHTADPSDRHQIVHIMLEPLGYPPFGILEGAYLYCMGSWEGMNLHMLAKDAIMSKQLPAFHFLLNTDHMNEVGMSICAPAWASFCTYLIDRYGTRKFMKLYVKTDKIEEAGAFNTVFKSIYGEDLDVIDRAWRLWVLRYKPT